ncbi:MAG: sigma factor, partial [Variovorax sp.]|nr:sigma factor [Variovorax sp.]
MAAAESVLHQEVRVLYGDHHGWLQGWLRRRLGSACDAADLAHDVFMRLLVLNLPMVGLWVKLLKIPKPQLYAG